jgi:integrase
MKRRTVDTKTRFEGVYARHSLNCNLAIEMPRCTCTPSYYGVVWDPIEHCQRKTKRFPKATAARDARVDLRDATRSGAVAPKAKKATLGDLRTELIEGVQSEVILNKWGRPYRKRAAKDLESALKHLPAKLLCKPADEVKSGEIQALIESLAEPRKGKKPLSGSRRRAVASGIRVLYRFAKDHEYAVDDPASETRLPAADEKPRDRVAAPAEFAELLAAIGTRTPAEKKEGKARSPRAALSDRIPYALGAYATARHQEIRVLDWKDVLWDVAALELAADEEGRKPGGSWRIVPIVAQLMVILREEWIAQGRPSSGPVCPPRRKSASGRISLESVQSLVHRRWRDLGLEPILLHEARHTAATWLDHAGVSPKVSSEIMGHKTPTYRPGAARITLQRYTHMLPGELERAREQLEAFLRERESEVGPPAHH